MKKAIGKIVYWAVLLGVLALVIGLPVAGVRWAWGAWHRATPANHAEQADHQFEGRLALTIATVSKSSVEAYQAGWNAGLQAGLNISRAQAAIAQQANAAAVQVASTNK